MNRYSANFCLILFFLMYANICFAKDIASLRIGRHPDFIRIVFEMKEEYIRSSSVKHEKGYIVVDFPLSIDLLFNEKRLPKKQDIDIGEGALIHLKEKGCVINIKDVDKIKVSNLSSPSRLVIDIYFNISETTKNNLDISKSLLIIDAGHGGYDEGIRGKNFIEKQFTLLFANELLNAFVKRGIKRVFLVRKSDYFFPIKERIKLINQRSPKIFISIHISSNKEFLIYTKNEGNRDSNFQEIINKIINRVKSDIRIEARHEYLPLSILNITTDYAFLVELPNPDLIDYGDGLRDKFIKVISESF